MSRLWQLIPSRRWLVLPPLVVGVLVVGALAMSKKPLPRVEPKEVAIPVDVVTVDKESIRATVTGYGTARPKRIWTAVAEVGGRAIKTHSNLRSGNLVTADELLLQIDPKDYDLRIEQRNADLAQAKAQLEQINAGRLSDEASLELQRSLLEVRQLEKDRLQQLRGGRAASKSEWDSAQAVYLAQALSVQNLERTIALTPAQIRAANAAIDLAKARLDEAKRDRDRTNIRAPFAGLLSDVNLQPQQYVAPGERLFELHDTSTIEVESQFSIAQMSRLVIACGATNETEENPEQITADELLSHLKATVTVRSGDVAIKFSGTPVRVSGTVDEQTRTLGVVVEIEAAGQLGERPPVALRSGVYCEVILEPTAGASEIVVPRTAVQSGFVYLVDESNRLTRRAVSTRISLGRDLILEELMPGDRLVIQPPADAAVGMLVQPSTVDGDDTVVPIARAAKLVLP